MRDRGLVDSDLSGEIRLLHAGGLTLPTDRLSESHGSILALIGAAAAAVGVVVYRPLRKLIRLVGEAVDRLSAIPEHTEAIEEIRDAIEPHNGGGTISDRLDLVKVSLDNLTGQLEAHITDHRLHGPQPVDDPASAGESQPAEPL